MSSSGALVDQLAGDAPGAVADGTAKRSARSGAMDVLITGAHGRVGTAIADHIGDDDRFDFTYLDVETHPPRVVGDARSVRAHRFLPGPDDMNR